jgi:hypothetical protein
MTRRTFGHALATLLVALGLRQPSVQRRAWGPVGVRRHRALCRIGTHLHVYHRGEDVTLRCRFFDDRPGRKRAVLYLHQDGRPYVVPGTKRPAMEVVSDFEVRVGTPFSARG